MADDPRTHDEWNRDIEKMRLSNADCDALIWAVGDDEPKKEKPHAERADKRRRAPIEWS